MTRLSKIFQLGFLSLGTRLSLGVGVMTLALLVYQEQKSYRFAAEQTQKAALSDLQKESDEYAGKLSDLEESVLFAFRNKSSGNSFFDKVPAAQVFRTYTVDEIGTVRDESFSANPSLSGNVKSENFIPEISWIRVPQPGVEPGDLEGRVLEDSSSSTPRLLLSTRTESKVGRGKKIKTVTEVKFAYVSAPSFKPNRAETFRVYSGGGESSGALNADWVVKEVLAKHASPVVRNSVEKEWKDLGAYALKGKHFGVALTMSWTTAAATLRAEKKKDAIAIALGALISFLVMMLFSRVVLRKLTDEVEKKTILEQELKVASAVQESLFPSGVSESKEFQIYGKYLSAAICGGDWWNHFAIDRKLCFMVADATGHGVSSALITASARGAFSVIQKLAETDPTFPLSPGLMMDIANRVVFDSARTKVMMTAFIGVVDLDSMKLIYANASHNSPWLYRKSGGTAQAESLVPDGLRLGEEEFPPTYNEFEIALNPGDTIVLYSDGYLENQNAKGEVYGKKRARKKIEENLGAHPQSLIDSLVNDFKAFNGDKPLDDDATLAAIRILNPSTESSV